MRAWTTSAIAFPYASSSPTTSDALASRCCSASCSRSRISSSSRCTASLRARSRSSSGSRSLIEGKAPRTLQSFVVSYLRYLVHVSAYVHLAAGPFPPFGGGEELSHRPRDRSGSVVRGGSASSLASSSSSRPLVLTVFLGGGVGTYDYSWLSWVVLSMSVSLGGSVSCLVRLPRPRAHASRAARPQSSTASGTRPRSSGTSCSSPTAIRRPTRL